VLKYIKEGYAIGVLIDMDSSRVRGKFIPAFGRLSNMPIGQSVLGLKTGAGFVPMACLRSSNRYKVIIKPEVTIERTDDFEADLYNITARCAGILEGLINEYKDQWVWMHNRWRTRAEKKDEQNE
jgi:KDO2-lipid IV(A) lauroyltransferase